MVQRITFSLLFALLGLLIQDSRLFGMQRHTPRGEQGASAFLYITTENIGAYLIQLEELAQEAQRDPAQRQHLIDTYYTNARFENQELRTHAFAIIQSLISDATTVSFTSAPGTATGVRMSVSRQAHRPITAAPTVSLEELIAQAELADDITQLIALGSQNNGKYCSAVTNSIHRIFKKQPHTQQATQQSFVSRYRYPLILGSCALAVIGVMHYFKQIR